jgi:hypothetical protein
MITTQQILELPDTPGKRAMLEQLRPRARAVQAPPRGNGEILAISVTISLYTTTEANAGGHFVPKIKRAKKQRACVRDVFRKIGLALPLLPAKITLTRIGQRKLDSDNLASALKHVRDEIAAAYQVDDADSRYAWEPQQERGEGYAVRIQIETLTGATN